MFTTIKKIEDVLKNESKTNIILRYQVTEEIGKVTLFIRRYTLERSNQSRSLKEIKD